MNNYNIELDEDEIQQNFGRAKNFILMREDHFLKMKRFFTKEQRKELKERFPEAMIMPIVLHRPRKRRDNKLI